MSYYKELKIAIAFDELFDSIAKGGDLTLHLHPCCLSDVLADLDNKYFYYKDGRYLIQYNSAKDYKVSIDLLERRYCKEITEYYMSPDNKSESSIVLPF